MNRGALTARGRTIRHTTDIHKLLLESIAGKGCRNMMLLVVVVPGNQGRERVQIVIIHHHGFATEANREFTLIFIIQKGGNDLSDGSTFFFKVILLLCNKAAVLAEPQHCAG